uniref:Uncharacterized protein n=1 Tax=Phytophthora ramorum TaxID=164328 RepID=H3GPY1_PHYRM
MELQTASEFGPPIQTARKASTSFLAKRLSSNTLLVQLAKEVAIATVMVRCFSASQNQQLQQVRAVAAQNPMLVGKATLDVIVSVPEKPEPSEAEDMDAVLAEPVAVATLKAAVEHVSAGCAQRGIENYEVLTRSKANPD